MFFIYVYYSNDQDLEKFNLFKKILLILSKNINGVIVNNSKYKLNIPDKNIEIINGTNISHEFSGYQEGYDFLNQKFNVNKEDIFIVSNDTIFNNHYYSILTIYYIDILFNKYKLQNKFVIGEIDKCKTKDFNYWISSYFFISNKRTLDEVYPFCLEKHEYKKIIEDTNPPKIFWNNFFSESLQKIIDDFLNPGSKNSWYQTHKKTFSKMHFNIKLYNTINERMLTDKFVKANAKIYNIRGNIILRITRLFEMYILRKYLK